MVFRVRNGLWAQLNGIGDRLHRMARSLALARGGNVAIVFGLSLVTLVTAVGAGIDLMRAYGDQQKLSAVAALACQYATRPSIIQTAYPSESNHNSGSLSAYAAEVSGFVTTTLHSQFPPNSPSYNLTPSLSGGPGSLSSVSLTSSVPTLFMQIAGFRTVPIGATSNCYSTPNTSVPQVNNNNTLVKENFTNSLGAGVHYIEPSGSQGSQNGHAGSIPLNNSFPSSPGFTGSNGSQWYIMGYCLETDTAGEINAVVPNSGTSAELDCDNGSGAAGNSSISTQVYLELGNYELRYFYAGRVDYPDYDPVYLCGSSANDLSWANDTTTSATWAGSAVAGGSRSNQLNVYLDAPIASTGLPPTHTTLDGTQTLAGYNLIDECLYSPPNGNGLNNNAVWVQRSVRIYINTPGYYWLSFAADGHSDSFGGQISNITLCQGTCPGTVQDNFPSVSYNPYYPGGSINTSASSSLPDWLNPNGNNKGLFTETFESPRYGISSGQAYDWNVNEDLNASAGTSSTTSSGWPSLTSSGWSNGGPLNQWATGPINQVEYMLSPVYDTQNYPVLGSQYIDLFGQHTTGASNGYSRVISRPFLLVPGYYNLSYYYMSDFVFSGFSTNTTYCLPAWTGGSGPTAASLNVIGYYNTAAGGTLKPGTFFVNSNNSQSLPAGMNTVAAFIANGQLSSTPIGGGAVNSTTSYLNPDSNLADMPPRTTTSTTPTAPVDSISAGSYAPATNTALLDLCSYSTAPTPRSIAFQINKPGIYWVTFSSEIAYPTTTNAAGAIDDIVLTALGGLSMTPPTYYAPVPVGAPQAGSQLAAADGSGDFYIIADPISVPAPLQ
jgi:Flp pilus assembly protein TadG